MAIVEAVSEMSATRLSVWFGAVLFVATTLVHSQVTWTPIYVGTYSEYFFFAINLSYVLCHKTWPYFTTESMDSMALLLLRVTLMYVRYELFK